MSTVSRRSRRLHHQHGSFQGVPAAKPRRTATKWLGMLGAMLVVTWLAPMIIGWSPLRHAALRQALPAIDGELSCRSASLGWFSGPRFDGVQVTDPQGNQVVRIAQASTDRPLWRLLTDDSTLGNVSLVRPQADVRLSTSGSNVEEVFAAWMSSDSGSLETASLELEVIDGSATIHQGDQQWDFNRMRAQASVPPHLSTPVEFTLETDAAVGSRSGRLKGQGHVRWIETARAETATAGAISCEADKLPLESLQAMLARLLPDYELAGTARGWLDYTWSPQMETDALARQQIQGELTVEQLELAAPWLEDQLQLTRLHMPCKLGIEGTRLAVERLEVDCDLGKLAGHGTLGLDDQWLDGLANYEYTVDGKLDMAAVAKRLPNTIRLRQGTTIQQGQLDIKLASRAEQDATRWTGKLTTTDLQASSPNGPVTWKQPLQAELDVVLANGEFDVQRLLCWADFIELEAIGDKEHFSIAASYDLQRLTDHLADFVDLRDVALAGDGWTYLTWQQTAPGRFESDGEIQVRKLNVTWPGGQSLVEENLIVLAQASGQAEGLLQPALLNAAKLRATSGPDWTEFKLREPVKLSEANSWTMDGTVTGDLARWKPRLESIVGRIPDWQVAGNGGASLNLTYQPGERPRLTGGAELDIKNVHLWGPGIFIDEPYMQMDLSGTGQADLSAIDLSDIRVHMNGLNLNSDGVKLALAEDGTWTGNGRFSGHGDVTRVWQALHDPLTPSQLQWGGRWNGNLQLEQKPSEPLRVSWQGAVDNLVANSRQGDFWHEPRVGSQGTVQWNSATDRLSLEQVSISGSGISCSADGEITELSGPRRLDLHGFLEYDLAQLAEILRPTLGHGVQITGKRREAFNLSGELNPAPTATTNLAATPLAAAPLATQSPAFSLANLQGNARLSWDRGDIYGFSLGGSRADATLSGGMLHLPLRDVPLSGGRLNVNSAVRFEPAPRELLLGAGRVMDNVQVSPEMCNQWLMYVAPVVAGVAQAQGRFSIDLEGAHLPIEAPSTGDLAGRLALHEMQISAGPLIREIAAVLGKSASVQMARESTVTFRMVGGRVYHRDLELVFPEATVRTFGSVGMDGSLALTAEMPVPEKWVGNNRLGTALRNRTITLPIGGTLENPQIDAVALRNVSSQFLEQAAGDVLRGELNKQLDRFFSN